MACGSSAETPADGESSSGEDSRTGPQTAAATSTDSGETTHEHRLDVGGTTEAGPTEACASDGLPTTLYALRTSVMVLVDGSQTMVGNRLDHDRDPGTPEITRWSMLMGSVIEYVDAFLRVADLGVQSFPRFDAPPPPAAGACDVAVDGSPPPTPAHEILDYLPSPGTNVLAGATPTAEGLVFAWEMLPTDPAHERRVVILTDGAPNCSSDATTPNDLFEQPDERAPMLVQMMAEQGISTHVIGIDVPKGTFGGGSEGDALTDHRARLEAMANAGGTELVLVDDAESLDDALADLRETVSSCRVRLPPELLEYEEVWLWIPVTDFVPLEVPLDDAACAAGERGYRYLEPGSDVVEFCGSACTDFRDIDGFAEACGVVMD